MAERTGFLRRAAERLLRSASDRTPPGDAAPSPRRWRLLQVESAIACHLDCVMCPWHDERGAAEHQGLMRDRVWRALVPHLPEVAEIDFSGGGEPLLQPALTEWIAEAHAAGCRTGFLTNAYHLDESEARGLVGAGVDWIATSIDGASKETYEAIRINSDFDRARRNLERLVELRVDDRPRTLVNFVLMPRNRHEVEAMVRLVADLGLDQLLIKQADVIRGEHGKDAGLFERRETREVARLQAEVTRAERLGRSLGLEMKVYPFTPEAQAVCAQEPHRTLFVRYDGLVSACISLARGGPTTFFGEDAVMPTVAFGQLPDDDLLDIWEGEACRRYRECFEARIRAYETVFLAQGLSSKSPAALEKTTARARAAMPAPCPGCDVCHYLYGV